MRREQVKVGERYIYKHTWRLPVTIEVTDNGKVEENIKLKQSWGHEHCKGIRATVIQQGNGSLSICGQNGIFEPRWMIPIKEHQKQEEAKELYRRRYAAKRKPLQVAATDIEHHLPGAVAYVRESYTKDADGVPDFKIDITVRGEQISDLITMLSIGASFVKQPEQE